MNGLRRRFERFCLKHRNWGIPNLMLYVVLGSGLIYFADYFIGDNMLYSWLWFDKALILKGQVWRIFSFVFTHAPGSNPFWVLLGCYFFYNLGRHVELSMGKFRFNLFYFTGVILMAGVAMIICPTQPVILNYQYVSPDILNYFLYYNMAQYMHMALLLTFAASNPDSTFLIFMILPVKAWFWGIIYLAITALDMYNLRVLFPHNLFPLVALGNFVLFMGKDALNLLPPVLRPGHIRPRKAKKPKKAKPAEPIPYTPSSQAAPKAAYMHRCTVCGRTDVSDPELEFRYCSKCNGYFCYCQDHINNHTHVE